MSALVSSKRHTRSASWSPRDNPVRENPITNPQQPAELESAWPALSSDRLTRQAPDDPMQCCYICLEDGGELFCTCQCTNRFLHLHCQQALVDRTQSHRAGCPVCQAPYSNARITRHTQRMTRDGKRGVVYAIGVLCVMLISVYELHMYMQAEDDAKVALFVVSAVFFGCALSFAVMGVYVFSKVQLLVTVQRIVVGRPTQAHVATAPRLAIITQPEPESVTISRTVQ